MILVYDEAELIGTFTHEEDARLFLDVRNGSGELEIERVTLEEDEEG